MKKIFQYQWRHFFLFLGSPTSSGIYVENTVDFGDVENFRDIDFFMRLKTGIKNGGRKGPPVFYSDQVKFWFI